MSNQQVTDYLTKQLFIEKSLVTFRSLSREFKLHVNNAKNELAVYHNNAPRQSQVVYATYLLSGVLGPSSGSQSLDESQDVEMDRMESTQESQTDEDDDGYADDGEEVEEITVMLVNEKDVDSARSKYRTIESMHIYSLSPSPLHDAGLICTPNDSIRTVDVSDKAAEVALVVGRIISPIITVPQFKKASKPKDAKVTKTASGPSKEAERPTLKNAAPRTKANFFVAKPAEKKPTREPSIKKPESEEETKESARPASKSIPESKKEMPTESRKSAPAIAKKAPVIKKEPSPVPSETGLMKSSDPRVKVGPPKRGTKRKSTAGDLDASDGHTNESRAPTPAVQQEKVVRVKKGALLSDEEDDEVIPKKAPPPKAKQRLLDSDGEDDVTGLMDIDDDQVTRVSRTSSAPKKYDTSDAEEAASDQEDEMDVDEPASTTKPKTKRKRKQVPIGKNGLKKRRVMKQKQSIDAKGYMVFEDYSSYESVDEEEPEEKKPKKSDSKSTTKVKKEETSDSRPPTPQSAKPTLKPAATKAKPAQKTSAPKGQPKQKSLKNFFVAPKKT